MKLDQNKGRLERNLRAMEQKIVGTEDFFKLMCCRGFIRIDMHRGVIANTLFHVRVAPEEVDGFVERQIQEIMDALGGPPRPRNVLINNVIAYGSAALIVLGVVGLIKLIMA